MTIILTCLCNAGCADSTSAASQQDAETRNEGKQVDVSDKPQHTNLLISETSPYLLQHAHNPVNWHPWGPAAFAKAKEQNKPVFLSVGYSTCYWCHVMERESFEREDAAAVLNEHFIAIKVDREERPDVDEQFMLATQIVTGRGGWPNSVWLTPEGKPWMAGTYFPRDNFISVLRQLADVWKTKRPQVEQQAERLTAAIHRAGTSVVKKIGKPLGTQLVQQAAAEILKTADHKHGGFGTSPKFPPHGNLRLLSLDSVRSANSKALPVVVATLDAMLAGGVRDHIGGGFHRYSTDQHWLLPHFEKMLYDNAQLMRAYTDGFRLTNDVRYRDVVDEIFVWLQREMTSDDGAFYSAIDSESEHEEGRFYVWTIDEVIESLGDENGKLIADVYGFQTDGNFTEEATGKKPGTNIPHLPQAIAEFAATKELNEESLVRQLIALRETLLQERNKRVFPHLDDKVLTAWNGLMIESLAYAGRSFNEPRYLESASKAAEFVIEHMTRDGRLLRTHRAGQSKQPAFLNDYAFFIGALIELHAATDEERWLTEARRLADVMLSDFEDSEQGGFFFATAQNSDILSRSRNLYGGGNLPSGNAVAARVLLELDALESTPAYRQAAQRTLEGLSGLMWQSPASSESLVAAVDLGLRTGAIADDATSTEPAADKFTESPVAGVIRASTGVVRPGQQLEVTVELTIDDGWHLYGANPDAEFLVPSTVTLKDSPAASVVNSTTTAGKRKHDPVIDQDVVVFEGNVVFTLTIQITNDAQTGDTELTFNVRTQACDEQRCLEPKNHKLSLAVNVAAP